MKYNLVIRQYLQNIVKKKEEPENKKQIFSKIPIKVNPRLKEIDFEIQKLLIAIQKSQDILAKLCLTDTEIVWNRVAHL